MICVGAAVLAVFLLSGGGPKPGGQRDGTGLAAAAVSGGRLITSAGLSVRLPPRWVGKTAVLPQGGGVGLAWLQATNFSSGRLVDGDDPLKAMNAGQVAVTITDRTPQITHIPPQNGSPLSVSQATPVAPAETPRGHVVLELTPTIRGRALSIGIDFGSRDAELRLAPAVNHLLQTLVVRPVPSRAAP